MMSHKEKLQVLGYLVRVTETERSTSRYETMMTGVEGGFTE